MPSPLLTVNQLEVRFSIAAQGWRQPPTMVHAVNGVSFSLDEGEILGVVGESGSGKSTLARSILRLGPISGGEIQLAGRPLHLLDPDQLRSLRPMMQMVFQDPYGSLNPRMTLFETLAEPLRRHSGKELLQQKVLQLMDEVQLASRHLYRYPHEFSGGQRQRIAIARALASQPRLLIADEPLSALDVSVQSQILKLLLELKDRRRLAMLLISHDLAVVRHAADRVAVMYLGRLVETAPAQVLFAAPRHPYTQALIEAIPSACRDQGRPLLPKPLKGEVPSAVRPPPGCSFHPRCVHAQPGCQREVPALKRHGESLVACLRAEELERAKQS